MTASASALAFYLEERDMFEPKTPEEFLFAYEESSGGWWWVCKNINDLTWYHLNDTKYEKAIAYYLHHQDESEMIKKFGPESLTADPEEVRAAKFTYAILMFSRKIPNCTFIDACKAFRMEVAEKQMEEIHQYGGVMINKAGGYHRLYDYEQWVRRKSFLYPDYKESDIRVSRYPGGIHWYVHIGDMELHQGQEIKWNTESEARAAAKKYVEEV